MDRSQSELGAKVAESEGQSVIGFGITISGNIEASVDLRLKAR